MIHDDCDGFLHIEELQYIIVMEYPNLVPGRDWKLMRRMCPEGKTQTCDAEIYEWNAEIPQPTIESLKDKWERAYKPMYAAWHKAAEIRQWRNNELTFADTRVYILEDAGNTELAKKWRAYRQILRDLPDQAGFPMHVQLPTRPAAS